MWRGFYFLAALAVHECFHLLAGRLVFREGIRVTFLPAGFRASWKSFQPEIWVQCATYAAGPAGNFIAAAVLALLPVNDAVQKEFVRSNLLIGLFNLIPLYPMDGGSILLLLLYRKVGSVRTIGIIRGIGCVIRVLLTAAGFYVLFAYKNPSLFLAIVFLPGIQSVKRLVNRLNLNALIRRREKILKKKAYPIRHILLLKDVRLGEAVLYLNYDEYHIISIVDNDLRVLRQVSEQELIDAMMDLNAGKTLEEAFSPADAE